MGKMCTVKDGRGEGNSVGGWDGETFGGLWGKVVIIRGFCLTF